MTTDEKIRYGIMALGAASVVAAGFGIHFGPVDISGAWGS